MRSTTSPSIARLSSLILNYGHELGVAEDGFAEFSHYRKLLGRISRKRRRAAKIQKLIDQDTATRRKREERLRAVTYVFQQSGPTDLTSSSKIQPLAAGHSTTPHPNTQTTHLPPGRHRSQKYANSFIDLRPARTRSRTLVQ